MKGSEAQNEMSSFRYFTKAVDLELMFVTGGDGKVTKMEIYQGWANFGCKQDQVERLLEQQCQGEPALAADSPVGQPVAAKRE